MDDETLQNLHALTHPSRFRVYEALLDGDPEGMYLDEIVDEVEGGPKEITHAALTLTDYDLVETELKVKEEPTEESKGKAGKVYKPAPEGRRMVRDMVLGIREILEDEDLEDGAVTIPVSSRTEDRLESLKPDVDEETYDGVIDFLMFYYSQGGGK